MTMRAMRGVRLGFGRRMEVRVGMGMRVGTGVRRMSIGGRGRGVGMGMVVAGGEGRRDSRRLRRR